MRRALLAGWVTSAVMAGACSSFESSSGPLTPDASVQDASTPAADSGGDGFVDSGGIDADAEVTPFCTGKHAREFCDDFEGDGAVDLGWTDSALTNGGKVGIGTGSSSTRGMVSSTPKLQSQSATAQLATILQMHDGPITLAFDALIDHVDSGAGFSIADVDLEPSTTGGEVVSIGVSPTGNLILTPSSGGPVSGALFEKFGKWAHFELTITIKDSNNIDVSLHVDSDLVAKASFGFQHETHLRLIMGVFALDYADAHQIAFDNIECATN